MAYRSQRSQRVARLETTTPNQFVEVEVYFKQGGFNHATYGTDKRGFYLSVKPVTVEGHFTSYTAFSGFRDLLCEVSRFSAKKLAELAAQAPALPQYQRLIEAVIAQNKIQLKPREASVVVTQDCQPATEATPQAGEQLELAAA